MSARCIHGWQSTVDDETYCVILCGQQQMVVERDESVSPTSQTEETCRHVWECLRDRCHNRGKGKYQAYKCRECGKFQRR